MQQNAATRAPRGPRRLAAGPIIDDPAIGRRHGNERPPDGCALPARRIASARCSSGASWLPDVGGPVARARHAATASTTSRASPPTIEPSCSSSTIRSRAIRAAGATAAARRDSPTCSPTPAPTARDPRAPWFLAPCDLQAIKASGVTFVVEHARARDRGAGARRSGEGRERCARAIVAVIGDNLSQRAPGLARGGAAQGGADRAGRVVAVPRSRHRPRCRDLHQVAADVGGRASAREIGIHPKSEWNNPEPEIVLAVNSRGRTVGATLGNDVNLRDFEGRSALLLGKAKDNNASCAIGPFIRLFDEHFGIDDVRRCELAMRVDGPEGFALDGASSMAMISRDPLDLVAQAIGAEPPVSGRPRAVPRHDVRADQGSARRRDRASRTSSATSSPSRRRRSARSSTASTTPTRSRRGPSAPAR